MKSSLPNLFSLARALIAPVFYVMIVSGDGSLVQSACALFLVGALTDYIDGWWARRFSAVTRWGAFFDPLADKLLTIAAFVAFATMGILPLWMVLVIISRDVITTVLRIYGDRRDRPIKTSYSAKVKTFLQMTFIAILLALIFEGKTQIAGIALPVVDSILHSDIVYYSMLGLTVFTIWTVIEYIYQNRELISQIWCETA